MAAYQFPSDAIKKIVWERTLFRGETDGDCLLWTGPISKENIAYWTYSPITAAEQLLVPKKIGYQVLKLAYQIYNPDIVLTNSETVVATCGKNTCFAKEHLVVKSKKSEWNPDEAWIKIQAMSNRADVIENQEIGCLLWQGQKDKKGYGVISIFGKKYPVHLLSVMIKDKITEIPKDNLGRRLVTRHQCKEKRCCEPSHLLLGTFDENNFDDKMRDGIIPRGEDVHNSTLTVEQVVAIKNSWKPLTDPEWISAEERAKLFNVPKHQIHSIDNGTWAHIKGKNDEQVQNRVKAKKELQQKTREQVRKNGIPRKDYIMLKEEIYGKSTIQEAKDNDINNVPCRLWGGYVHPSGYGRLQYKYSLFLAHVIICEWKNNMKKPEGMVTRHLCGNKLCVEEHHLQFGTNRENMIDALEKKELKGKLDFEKAAEIRSELDKDSSKKKYEELAAKYNVTPATVKSLKHNNAWKRN